MIGDLLIQKVSCILFLMFAKHSYLQLLSADQYKCHLLSRVSVFSPLSCSIPLCLKHVFISLFIHTGAEEQNNT